MSNYDQRHGGPYDRGNADKWYGREYDPHYFVGDTYDTVKVELKDMSADDVAAYTIGYNEGETK